MTTAGRTPRDLLRMRVNALLENAKGYLSAGRYREAADAFEIVINLDPTSIRAHAGRAFSLTRLGRYDDALAAADAILALEKDSPAAYNVMAECYEAMDDNERARDYFEKAVHFGSTLAFVHYNYACFWARRREPEECRRHLQKALQLNPSLNTSAATDVDFWPFRTYN